MLEPAARKQKVNENAGGKSKRKRGYEEPEVSKTDGNGYSWRKGHPSTNGFEFEF